MVNVSLSLFSQHLSSIDQPETGIPPLINTLAKTQVLAAVVSSESCRRDHIIIFNEGVDFVDVGIP